MAYTLTDSGIVVAVPTASDSATLDESAVVAISGNQSLTDDDSLTLDDAATLTVVAVGAPAVPAVEPGGGGPPRYRKPRKYRPQPQVEYIEPELPIPVVQEPEKPRRKPKVVVAQAAISLSEFGTLEETCRVDVYYPDTEEDELLVLYAALAA